MSTTRNATSSPERYEVTVDVQAQQINSKNKFTSLKRSALANQYKINLTPDLFCVVSLNVTKDGMSLSSVEENQFWQNLTISIEVNPLDKLENSHHFSIAGPTSPQDEFINRICLVNNFIEQQIPKIEASKANTTTHDVMQQIDALINPTLKKLKVGFVKTRGSLVFLDAVLSQQVHQDTLTHAINNRSNLLSSLKNASGKNAVNFEIFKNSYNANTEIIKSLKCVEISSAFPVLSLLEKNIGRATRVIGGVSSLQRFRSKRIRENYFTLAADMTYAATNTYGKYVFYNELINPALKLAIPNVVMFTTGVELPYIAAELLIFGTKIILPELTIGAWEWIKANCINPNHLSPAQIQELRARFPKYSPQHLTHSNIHLRIRQIDLQPNPIVELPTISTHINHDAIKETAANVLNDQFKTTAPKNDVETKKTIFKNPIESCESSSNHFLTQPVIPNPSSTSDGFISHFGFENGNMTYTGSLGKNTEAKISADVIGLVRMAISGIKKLTRSEAQKAAQKVDDNLAIYVKRPSMHNTKVMLKLIKKSAKLNFDDKQHQDKLKLLSFCINEKDINGLSAFVDNNAYEINRIVDTYNQKQNQLKVENEWKTIYIPTEQDYTVHEQSKAVNDVIEKEKLNSAAESVSMYLEKINDPLDAFSYIKNHLKNNPTNEEAWNAAEDICTKTNNLELLNELYLEHTNDYELATEKSHQITQQLNYRSINQLCNGISAATSLIQLFANIQARGLNEKNSGWNRSITTINVAAPLVQHGLLPYLRHRAHPKLHPNKINAKQLSTTGGIAASMALLNYAQERNFMWLGNDRVRNITNTGLEATFLATDTWSLFGPEINNESIEKLSNLLSHPNELNANITSFFSNTHPSDIASTLADNPLDVMSACGIGLHAYEFGCRVSGYQLPENTTFHVSKNFLTIAPPVIKGTGAILSGCGSSWVLIGGKIYAIAAGSLTGFGVVVVVGVAGTYLVYQGGKLIHQKTTVQGKTNNISYNAADLAKQNSLKQALLKLDEIPEHNRTPAIKSQRSDYQCRLFFDDNNPLAVVTEATTQLNQRESLDKRTVKTFLDYRFSASASLKENELRDIKELYQDYVDLKSHTESSDTDIKRYSDQMEVILLKLHHQNDTKQFFANLIKDKPNDIEARLFLLHLARIEGDYKKAEDVANQAETLAEKICLSHPENSRDFKAANNLREKAKEKHATIREDIKTLWASSAGLAVGKTTGEAVGQAICLGAKLISASVTNHEAEIECKFPFWQKTGSYSRKATEARTNTRAARYTHY
ncbi:MAG: hypothetical protein P4M12_06140 [Gammaproteobacteria bacterium]|nr:hypothetical protein [Gammaproteobacteria bacterium]